MKEKVAQHQMQQCKNSGKCSMEEVREQRKNDTKELEMNM